MWVHYFDPHAGYDPHEGDPELAGLLPYDAEIGFMDRQIGRLLEHLRAAGRDRETLVVVAADHGEGLWEHGEISHGVFVYESTLRAALLLRLPDGARAGTRVAEPVSLVDVFPTVLARLGIAHEKVSGEPLPTARRARPRRRAPSVPLYFENHAVAYAFGLHPLRGVVRGDQKWIDAPQPERFDLAADPHEVSNLHSPGDPLSAELAAASAQLREASPRARPGAENSARARCPDPWLACASSATWRDRATPRGRLREPGRTAASTGRGRRRQRSRRCRCGPSSGPGTRPR